MEDVIKAEMRLFVLETLVDLLHASMHQQTGDPEKSLATLGGALIEKARRQTFGAVDPALSDLYSAELESAVEKALARQREWLGLPPR